MRFLSFIPLAILALPVAEVVASIALASQIGAGALALWYLASALIGIVLLRQWRMATAWALYSSIKHSEAPIRRLLWVARGLIAALLLVFPGPVSDVIALLLLLPWKLGNTTERQVTSDIIEGDFSRVDPAPVKANRLPSLD
ncbi:FxsA family protein [Parachitinimonas caeni]|uniref:FxsA family protein n=1 Tax=Parachitinimonas caeni TaxID=3031301 RepID=A0ABT7DVY5_9NEIS|nr:FxsA family protein [Parachitinimonas caeni]MDK2124218.1 FxsA family protein [Parachitinimonas caeni]